MQGSEDESQGLSVGIWQESQLVLGSVERGRQVLLDACDGYVARLEHYEMVARSRNPEINKETFQRMQASAVRPWKPDETEEIARLAVEIRDALGRFTWMPLPRAVYLFKTTGKEETGVETTAVAYCRGLNNVFISQANFIDPVARAGLKRLLLHELWHILARNYSDSFVDRVYTVFGFHRIVSSTPLSYPEEVSPLRFTNPDALDISHYIRLNVSDEENPGSTASLAVAPLLYLQPYNVFESSPFENISVAWGALALNVGSASWVCIDAEEGDDRDDEDNHENDDENSDDHGGSRKTAMLLPHGALPEDFWLQVSRNTEYVLHVEEIAAENFVLCVMEEKCQDKSKPMAMFEILATGTESDRKVVTPK